MFNLMATIIQHVPDANLILSDSFLGAFCLLGIIYTLFILILAWSGFVGWLIAVGISVFCIFNFVPMDDSQFVVKVPINNNAMWITKDDVNSGRYVAPEVRKMLIEKIEYYYRPHVIGKYSWRLYHPVMWWTGAIIGLGLSPYTYMIIAIVITFGGAGKNT
jgi:hypothetical protein